MEETSFAASRKALKAKQLRPMNATWDDSKLTELGISMDGDLKRTLTQCYRTKSWRSHPIRKNPTPIDVSSLAKAKKQKISDSGKADSECTSTSAEISEVEPTPDQEIIKIGMRSLLTRLKIVDYATRVELAFCLKAICEVDKVNHNTEHGACVRLSKVFIGLGKELGKSPLGGQKGYLQNMTEIYLQVLISKSGEYPSEGEREGRLNAILSEHAKRLGNDLVFSSRETYLEELIGGKL